MQFLQNIFNKHPQVTQILMGSLFAVALILINIFIVRSEYVFYCNSGIAFGIKLPLMVFVLMWSAVMLIVLFLWMMSVRKTEGTYKNLGFLLIFSGGMANISDRVLHGCVIDYIAIVPWNIFNLSDVCICIGAALVLWYTHSEKNRRFNR